MKHFLSALLVLFTVFLHAQTFFGKQQTLANTDPYGDDTSVITFDANGDNFPDFLLNSDLGLLFIKNNTDGTFTRQRLNNKYHLLYFWTGTAIMTRIL